MVHVSVYRCTRLKHSAEGAVAKNSQAKGPDLDETLESKEAPKKIIFQVEETEAYLCQKYILM